MTAGAQGHPGWVDNHPTTLKFLAASQACLHPSTFTTLITPTTFNSSFNSSTSDNSTKNDLQDDSCMDTSDSADVEEHQVSVTAAKPSLLFKTKDQIASEANVGVLTLNPNIQLPQHISELLLSTACRNFPFRTNCLFLSMFSNTKQCRLKTVDLRGTQATDDAILALLNHNLLHLDIRECSLLTNNCWKNVGVNGQSLVSLAASKNVLTDLEEEDLDLPLLKLQDLTIENAILDCDAFPLMFKNLSFMNLSGCEVLSDISCLTELRLISLSLYNCNHSEDWFPHLMKIKTLRRLDISRNKNQMMEYHCPEGLLQQLVEALPHLCYLDISGTNLTGARCTTIINCPDCGQSQCYCKRSDVLPRSHLLVDDTVPFKCDVAGLVSRVRRPLDVLGLCHTTHDACKWENIPALKILGDASECQILDTVEMLMPYKEQVTTALNELFHLFRYDKVDDVQRALRLIFMAMTQYHYDEHVQISSSASLFYIMRSEAERQHNVTCAARQQMVTLMINAMERFPKDNILMRNGCLTFSQLKVPQQVLFEYERLVALLLSLIRHRSNAGENSTNNQDDNMAGFVCRISIYLLNSLACQVEGFHKRLVGDLGAVETMLSLICDKLLNKRIDDILELAWSVMWNVTDETPANCQRFLDGQGMMYFTKCLKEFPGHEDLLRNMMGLLGNVAEVETLRRRLLTAPLIVTFRGLLRSKSGGIEVSYNAAGVLSHIASDGPEAWTLDQPSRESVLAELTAAITKWDITVRRNINYRSFEPILRLLSVQHTPPCQHWAAWALANLTRVYPEKYCSLVASEGGLEILQKVVQQPGVGEHIAHLARTVIAHCTVYSRDGNLRKLYEQDREANQ